MTHFVCPLCSAGLDYPLHGSGSMVRCPGCQQLVSLLAPLRADAQSSPDSPPADTADGNESGAEHREELLGESTPAAASLGTVVHARELMTSCRFAEAADLLTNAPREKRQPELTSLLMHVQYLRGLRDAAFESLGGSEDSAADVERYIRVLQSENLRDAELEQQLDQLRKVADATGGSSVVLILAGLAAAALLGAIWLAFSNEPSDFPSNTSESRSDNKSTDPRKSAQARFADALQALRMGQRSEATTRWASAMAVAKGDESAECLEEYWQQQKPRFDQVPPDQRKAAAEELQQLDGLAAAGSGTLRIRLVRSELLQRAAELLITDQQYFDALGTLQNAVALVPNSPRTCQLAGLAIERMISAGAAGDPRFPSEIVIPVIDGVQPAVLSAADKDRLRTLLKTSQQQSLDAFIQTPLQASMQAALDAFQRLSLEEDLPNGSADAFAFDEALTARISADLDAGRLTDALLGLQKIEQIHGSVPELTLNSLRMLPRSRLQLLPESLRNKLLVRTSTIGLRFQLIQPGQFQHEGPDSLQTTTITRWYYLAETELTRGQYLAVTGSLPTQITATTAGPQPITVTDHPPTTPAPAANDALPVLLTWDEAQAFCETFSRLSEERQQGQSYRLATEAEWELACRTGSEGPWCFGNQPRILPQYAWYQQTSGGQLHEVATLRSSQWGIFDQHGNAEEWVRDWFGPRYLIPISDPQGPETGTLRTVRGGNWLSDPADLTVNSRRGLDPGTDKCGVRLVQELSNSLAPTPP